MVCENIFTTPPGPIGLRWCFQAGSEVTAILPSGWILSIGGASAVKALCMQPAQQACFLTTFFCKCFCFVFGHHNTVGMRSNLQDRHSHTTDNNRAGCNDASHARTQPSRDPGGGVLVREGEAVPAVGLDPAQNIVITRNVGQRFCVKVDGRDGIF